MKYKLLLFIFLVITLGYSVLGALGYDNTKLPRVSLDTSSCLCSTVSGNSSFNSSYVGSNFLKLTADNDPLTGTLEIVIPSGDSYTYYEDQTYASTYTKLGMLSGTPTWEYFDGENSQYVYFGGDTLYQENSLGSGWRMSSTQLKFNDVSGFGGGNVRIISPPALARNHTGGTLYLDAGNSTDLNVSKVSLRASRGGTGGSGSKALSEILEVTGTSAGGARVDVINATLNVSIVQFIGIPQVSCSTTNEGTIYYNATAGVKSWYGCNSTTWVKLND